MTRAELIAALMAERYAGPVREWRAPTSIFQGDRKRPRWTCRVCLAPVYRSVHACENTPSLQETA